MSGKEIKIYSGVLGGPSWLADFVVRWAGPVGLYVRDDAVVKAKNCENRPILTDFFEKMADFCGLQRFFWCKNALFRAFVINLLEFPRKFNCFWLPG